MTLSPYYYIYIFLLAGIALVSEHTKENKKYTIRREFFILITWIFFAFRTKAGFDYIYYEDIILNNGDLDTFEPIPRILAEASNQIGSFRLFVVYTASAYTFGLYSILKKKTHLSFFLLSILLWTPFGFFENFSWMRQSAAIGFFLVGYAKWIDNKKSIASAFFLIAILNHYSIITPVAITIFVTTISLKAKIRVAKIAIAITLVECAFHPISNGIIGAAGELPYANYLKLSDEYGQLGFLIWTTMTLIVGLFFITTKNKKILDNSNLLTLSVIGVLLYSIFFPFGQHASRIFMAFAPLTALSASVIADLFKPRTIIYIIIFALAILGTTYRLTAAASSTSDYDYLNKYELDI